MGGGLAQLVVFAMGLGCVVALLAGIGIARAIVLRTGNRYYWCLAPLPVILLPL